MSFNNESLFHLHVSIPFPHHSPSSTSYANSHPTTFIFYSVMPTHIPQFLFYVLWPSTQLTTITAHFSSSLSVGRWETFRYKQFAITYNQSRLRIIKTTQSLSPCLTRTFVPLRAYLAFGSRKFAFVITFAFLTSQYSFSLLCLPAYARNSRLPSQHASAAGSWHLQKSSLFRFFPDTHFLKKLWTLLP